MGLFIQAIKVLEARYLQGFTKTLNDRHWTDHYNVHPRLKKMDVQVKTKSIQDPIEEEGAKYNSRNHVFAAHILCIERDVQNVNIKISDLYNKDRKSSRAAADHPEARSMRYVPYTATHKIVHTNKRVVK